MTARKAAIVGSEPALQQYIPRSEDDILDTGDFLNAFGAVCNELLRCSGHTFDGQASQ